jgi:uroporphyrinogen decarboxylase
MDDRSQGIVMTDLERYHATLSGRRPDRILYSAGFTPDLERRLVEHAGTEDLAAHYGLFSPVAVGPRKPRGYQPPDYTVYYAGESLPKGTTIDSNGVAMIPADFYHFWGYHSPLRNATSIEQLRAYPLTDESDWPTDHMAKAAEAAHAAGKVVAGSVGHIYEEAWQVRGYEQFLLDLAERPEWAECLLDKLAARKLSRAVAAARAGADYLSCGDDVANQRAMTFSVPMWRHFMLARWAKVWAAARAVKPDIHVRYHSDGNIEPIIPDLLAAGVTVLNPIQPECMDPAALRRKYPDLNMDGTIGTQTTMPFGTPQDVRAAVRRSIDSCGASGRLILAPTHVLEPDVPIENFEAYVHAARAG